MPRQIRRPASRTARPRASRPGAQSGRAPNDDAEINDKLTSLITLARRAIEACLTELRAGPPRLPRSAAEDARMLRLGAALREKLRLMFPPSRTWHSLTTRNAAVRPIVEREVGHKVEDLPRTERLDSFVARLLEAETFGVVRRSRAARRQRRWHAKLLGRQELWCRTMLEMPDRLLKAQGREGLESLLAALRQDFALLREIPMDRRRKVFDEWASGQDPAKIRRLWPKRPPPPGAAW